MALKVAAVCLLLLVVFSRVDAQSCNKVQFQDCIKYSANGDSLPPSSSDCCTQVRAADQSCLCSLATTPSSAFYTIDFNQVLKFPKACGRNVAAGTKCNGTPVPV